MDPPDILVHVYTVLDGCMAVKEIKNRIIIESQFANFQSGQRLYVGVIK